MDQYQPLRRCLGSRVCKKCKTVILLPPTYHGDYWDCTDCDYSKEPTKAENEKLLRFLTEPEYRKRFLDRVY